MARRPRKISIRLSRLLVMEEPCLALQPTCITGERAICTDEPVAWHNDRHRIESIGRSDGTRRHRTANAQSKLPIRKHRPWRNRPQRLPDLLLKSGPTGGHRDYIERSQIAGQIGAHAVAKAMRIIQVGQLEWPVVPLQQLQHTRLAI